jgi:hypothetical protein
VAYEIATSFRYKKPLTVELLKEIITQHPKLRIVKAGPKELRLARKDLGFSTSKPQVKRFSTNPLFASCDGLRNGGMRLVRLAAFKVEKRANRCR